VLAILAGVALLSLNEHKEWQALRTGRTGYHNPPILNPFPQPYEELIPMKFRPLHDRVVVKRSEAETKSAGGIIIPDTAGEKPMQGEIIAAGPGARDEAGKLVPLDVKKGDKVLFGKWSGTEVKIDGVELLIMKESDIMGILDK
jgi:chaperonin GroES